MTERPHQLTQIVLGDAPDAWRTAGFAVDDAGRLRLGRTELLCLDNGNLGFVGWAFDGIDGDLDGLATAERHSGAPAGHVPEVHPNGISSIDHVVVRTGSCRRTIAAFEAAGLEVRGGRSTASYGAPMRQTFFWAGDVILELVGPDDGEPTTDEATSIFGLALVARDLDVTATAMGSLLGSPKPAVQPGRRIAGLRHRDAGIGLPIAVMSPHPH
ncbi:MAG: glyoxalase [Actinobacteria bacterium]|nr:glyoxalase [Actinomycetota bacterium]